MSGYELGLSDDHSGILVLPPDTPVGLPLAEALGDTVIQLDLKGRADCLAMIGVAREVGALTAVRPTITVAEPQPARERAPDEPVRIEIADPDLCARFTAVLLKGVRIGPSPAWMQERLQAAGVRPINNVVDVTNFVMLEWGQPLHAYDYDRVRGGALIARRARPGEVLLTLAAERPELELSPDQLVIADAERAVGLAGVIGGADTEVTEGTTAVLLEAANFLPVAIRRTARAFLPRPTEASRRFERGIPPEHTVPAALRAAQLIVELAGAALIGAPVDVYPQPRSRPVIRLNPGELERLIGVPYSAGTIEGVFDRLGFMYEQPGPATGGDYLVHAPVWRLDVERPADLVEEVVRIDGYEKIPTTLMRGEPPIPQSNPTLQWEEAVRDVLVGAGFAGLLTYPLTDRQRLARLPHMDGRDAAGRLAALVDDRIAPDRAGHPGQPGQPGPGRPAHLRNPLLARGPGGQPAPRRSRRAPLRAGAHLPPRRHRADRRPPRGAPRADVRHRRLPLGAADWGRQENDFYYVKAVAEAVLERMGISGHGYVAVQHPAFHPYQAAAVVLNHRPEAAGKKPVQPQEVLGIVGRLDETAAGAFDIKQRAFVVALDFDRLVEHAAPGRGYKSPPRTPAVIEDFSFLLARSTPAERLVASVQRAGAPLVESVTLKGIYGGEGIPEGFRSLTYTVVYRAPDHTLTAEEVSAVRARIVQAAERQTGAKLRS